MRTGPRNLQLYEKARALRTEGTPYKRIASALSISPATAFAWTSDVPLSAEQEERNRRGPLGPQGVHAQRRAVEAWAARCRGRRADAQSEGQKRAKCGDLLHQAGCMLYWAEGGKSRNLREVRQLRPADGPPVQAIPHRLARHRARRYSDFDQRLPNNGLSADGIERFWLDLLDLPGRCVRKHTLNHMPTSSSGRAKKRLPYGVCLLVVNSTAAVQHVYGAIQEYAGFEEPRWLD